MGLGDEGGPQDGGAGAPLDDFRVPGTGVFVLGCIESRVTVLSQQRRALNVADALLSEGFVGDGHRVAVVGAGAAGVTAAAALAQGGPGVEGDLFDHDRGLMRFQRSSDRDLHPRSYDWPLPDSTDPEAGLPILDWRSGPASSVATKFRSGLTICLWWICRMMPSPS